ncbi:MAG: hypothetical protein P8X64_08420 [Anaerolineales bacterium]|jgi:hypothetical protein
MARPLSRKILHGLEEPIFERLPQSVIANFDRPRSENALLWNCFYPRGTPGLDWRKLASLRPCWGTALDASREADDLLKPYFWGYDVSGSRLTHLDEVLMAVDGPGPKTEVDLFLMGRSKLIVVEAKHTAGLGRCSRYQAGRCPEIHASPSAEDDPCRYWLPGAGEMSAELDFGARPVPGDEAPACSLHYQLARTLLVGKELARRHKLEFHLWLILPRRSWRGYQAAWLDFARRVQSEAIWRRMRVLAWEAIQSYSA